MTAPTEQPRPIGRRWAWHLLWVLPLVLVIHYVGMSWMALAWCGLYGCTEASAGRLSTPELSGVVPGGLLVTMAWFTAVAVLPWHRSWRLRVIIGAVVGIAIAIAVITMLVATSFFVR